MLSKQEKTTAVKQWLSNSQLDASVTSQTLGASFTNISPAVLLAASTKLIKINKQEAEVDDRDDLRHAKFYGLEDFVTEHIEKDAGGFQQKAKDRIKQRKNLSWLQPGFFSPQVKSTIVGNSMAQVIAEGGPMDLIDVATKVTKLGPGGIPSTTAVPDESRRIHDSYFSWLDPFRLSESLDVGTNHRVVRNVRKGNDGKLYRLAIDAKTDKEIWVDHETLLNSRLEIPRV